MKVKLQEDVLKDQNQAAAFNRNVFKNHNMFVVNLMSSPGSGKTTLLEETVRALKNEYTIGVIEGDLATERDALRLRKLGVSTVQINTVGGCHLDARMVAKTLPEFDLNTIDLLFIENIGNLVCPSGYDLGQDEKIVVLSVPEGNDKIPKYPVMFKRTDVTVINKIDLLPYVDFSLSQAEADLASINPKALFMSLSAQTGEGMEEWVKWLREGVSPCTGQ
ncbi:hydrogenase nickel incorporation protein HypB [Bacillus sp. H-16]|uniref:hydrogenase nickel incorporation protein HypB n=1 Tax=Alteribacter salitolerans TaxID=2912333 RepID=UPI001965D6AE|nr:hydrogenase nickel incorporation protein HypB [Alteribacter salitolerans]MBM7096731.1 hydrogenase nickel incorporation protein HypB [Alteribacter salitolerans]